MNPVETNLRSAQNRWGKLSRNSRAVLRQMTEAYGVSVQAGELVFLSDCWYVTHTGLLRIARRNRCAGIDVRPAMKLCDPASNRWAFKATVYKSAQCRGFVGYGDADPTNVSPQVRGAEMRVAETRAVNRALRKAYGIGICSVEELGSFSGPLPPAAAHSKKSAVAADAANGNGHHPLRDQLCLLVRQHRLDGALVKAYAADFCDVAELRQAAREQVAKFITHLAEYAQRDRDGLLCQLNSYAQKAPGEALIQISNEGSRTGAEKAAGAA